MPGWCLHAIGSAERGPATQASSPLNENAGPWALDCARGGIGTSRFAMSLSRSSRAANGLFRRLAVTPGTAAGKAVPGVWSQVRTPSDVLFSANASMGRAPGAGLRRHTCTVQSRTHSRRINRIDDGAYTIPVLPEATRNPPRDDATGPVPRSTITFFLFFSLTSGGGFLPGHIFWNNHLVRCPNHLPFPFHY